MHIPKSRLFLVSVAALALAGWVACSAPRALAQPGTVQAPVKVAIANTKHIIGEMAEFKAFNIQMQDEEGKFKAAQEYKVKEINDLKSRRDSLLPEHPQWADLNAQSDAKTAEYRVWVETQKVLNESAQKTKMIALFKKVETAVAEIAKEEGIDLVMADNRDPLPADLDEMDIRTVRGMILQRDVLYATDRIDITEKVVTRLDAKFRAIAPVAPAAPPGK
jgi:Skp family chaperone for outer membrane proteins